MRQRIYLFIRLVRPLFLLAVVFQVYFALGIVRYLGQVFPLSEVLLLSGVVICLAGAGVFLNAHYWMDHQSIKHDWIARLLDGRYEYYSLETKPDSARLPPQTAILAASVCLVFATVQAYLLWGLISRASLIPILALLLLATVVIYPAPRFNLSGSGFGELVIAIGLVVLVPMMVFSVFTGEVHRLVPLVTLPLVFILLAVQIAFQFPGYLPERSADQVNLLQRMGWQNGIFFHNSFLLLGFFSLAIIPFAGVPLGVAALPMLVLPLAVWQIWNFRRIAEGGSPNWLSIRLTGLAIFAAVNYLLAYSFWVR
jgi:1,4-dihydroxy-2-naphthoate octaprenyltransferase